LNTNIAILPKAVDPKLSPGTMRSWQCERFSKPFEIVLKEVPIPVPGPGEVLIRVSAAGLAFGEVLILEGSYQKLPTLPYTPSSEMSGIVEACGEGVTRVRPGDRVAAFSVSLGGGGLAEYAVLPEAFVHPVGDNVDLIDAAGFLMNHWTAFNALVRRGAVKPGEFLVVHGATGGVGSAAVDVGKAIGATVIATGGDDERLSRSAADVTINYNRVDMRERILELTAGQGADVFFDPVGGDVFDASMRAIAPGGRILVVGFTSGRPAQARTNIVLVKMISIIGIEGRLAIERTGDEGWSDFRTMLQWFGEGRITAPKTTRIAFADAPQGFRRLLDRSHGGKCVVVM